jgi:hypothetical protein
MGGRLCGNTIPPPTVSQNQGCCSVVAVVENVCRATALQHVVHRTMLAMCLLHVLLNQGQVAAKDGQVGMTHHLL